MHSIASLEPIVIGCWKCWKHNNWKGTMEDICNVTDVVDDSNLEEEMMDDEEWSQHMSHKYDCSLVW